jgi:hypothetical protein
MIINSFKNAKENYLKPKLRFGSGHQCRLVSDLAVFAPSGWCTGIETCWGFMYNTYTSIGAAVAQLVEALRYKPEGRGFNSRGCHWKFSLS